MIGDTRSATPILHDRQWIAARIPHSYDMCLLDAVLAADQQQISCIASSHRAIDNPLRHRDRLGALCMIEYAAQAIAVHGALILQQQERPRAGYLTSVRNVSLHVTRFDDVADDLLISAQRISGDNATVLYTFSVRTAAETLADGRIAVLLDVDDLKNSGVAGQNRAEKNLPDADAKK